MLDGREDIAECMADAGAGLLIVPKDDPLTSLPEYRDLKGGKDPLRGRSYDEIIRGLGGTPGLPMASTDESHLLWTPLNPEVTAHEYAHSIQNLCFTPEDNAKWSALYDTALQANLFPGTYAMLTVHEFWAVFSNVYLGADRVLENGRRSEVRSTFETEVPGVWEFFEDIYGVLVTPSPDKGSVGVRYSTEGGEQFPWPTYVGGTYEDGELGYSIDVPPGWRDIPGRRGHPHFAMFFQHPQGSNLDISAIPLPNLGSLRSFAEGVRDDWLEWNSKNSQMFELDSFEEIREEGREAWFMTFSRPASAEHCPDVMMRLIARSSQYGEKPYVFILSGGTCQNYRAYDFQHQDLLDMLASFR